MRNTIKTVCASVFFFTLTFNTAAQTPPSLLGEFQVKQGQGYSVVKAMLLRRGWIVDGSYGNGQKPYGFSEVVCGNGYDAVCSARFVLGKREILVTLKPGKTLLVDGLWDDK
jgi:hypothetical protein